MSLPGRLAVAFLIALLPALGNAQSPSIGAFVSSQRAFSTVSYWIEGQEGLILVDTQFLPSDAARFLETAEARSGKKARLAFVLHPNPDKFNGTAVLQSRGVRVISSAPVRALIPPVHELRKSWFYHDYAPDYPKDAAVPESFGSQTQSFEVDGLTFVAHVLGPGCSAAHVVLQIGVSVFVGDLINPTNHAWLELGMIDEWVARLEEVRAMKPLFVYPGRGPAGGPELIDRQIAYLRFVQGMIREAQPEGDLRLWRKLWLQWRIGRAYPDLAFPGFMRDGLAKVWEVEARRMPR